MSLPSMDTTVTQSESGRPVKRRRGGSTNPDEPGCPVKSGIRQETSSVLPVKLTKIKTSSVTEAHLLTNEINQLLHADPALASQAIHLVELYQCLWDCYVMKCANKLRMQEERRLLQNSNACFDSVYFLDWTGPDILSPSTCADDIFFHLSTFHLLNKVDWADIRLYILSNVTDELVAVYPFFLPRVESMLGNLPRVRKLVQDMITSHDVGELRFRLSVRPRYQEEPDFKGTRTTFDSYIRPVVPLSPRDPYLFA
ncbi:hypothetical protein DTO013E5_9204 [Penicillium roqueforti]|nr:hypothetical protein DTO012A1_8740 [Penicillium roqueforti]KAI2738923.1 hypothetical protein DTO013F2_9477 [Penicillium roqueforti]KAI2765998.1 hypothetical protein DTO012A8_8789 [Penicillium roqueforti]KAI3199933.1 hypothetical protein DTO013E5_9204 [Penicillium roqueforti]KAI3249403.1 hypothetical protein DTO006G7_9177 [Penicillium roqueforti]